MGTRIAMLEEVERDRRAALPAASRGLMLTGIVDQDAAHRHAPPIAKNCPRSTHSARLPAQLAADTPRAPRQWWTACDHPASAPSCTMRNALQLAVDQRHELVHRFRAHRGSVRRAPRRSAAPAGRPFAVGDGSHDRHATAAWRLSRSSYASAHATSHVPTAKLGADHGAGNTRVALHLSPTSENRHNARLIHPQCAGDPSSRHHATAPAIVATASGS